MEPEIASVEETPIDRVRASRFLMVLLLLLTTASLLVIWPFLTGAVFALVVGFLLQGPHRRLVKLVRSRHASAVAILSIVLVLIVGPVLLMGYAMVDDAIEIANRVQASGGVARSGVEGLTGLGVPEETAQQVVADALSKLGALAQASLLPTLGTIGTIAANLGVFLFMLYFLLVEGPDLHTYVDRAIPLPRARREHLLRQIGNRVRALFLGTFLVAFIQGVVATLGWWLLGFPNPFFWGFIMTLVAVIPVVGPVLVMAPAGAIAITQGNIYQGVGLILYGLLVVGFVDNLTRPFVVGRSSGVHPGVVLIGTLGGLIVFGMTGFILGPLVVSMVAPVLEEWEAIRDEPVEVPQPVAAEQLPPPG